MSPSSSSMTPMAYVRRRVQPATGKMPRSINHTGSNTAHSPNLGTTAVGLESDFLAYFYRLQRLVALTNGVVDAWSVLCNQSDDHRIWQRRQGAIVPRSYLPPERHRRSEEHTSELQSLMRISYAVFCLKKKNKHITHCTVYINVRIQHNKQ